MVHTFIGLEHKYGVWSSSFTGEQVDALPFQNKTPLIYALQH